MRIINILITVLVCLLCCCAKPVSEIETIEQRKERYMNQLRAMFQGNEEVDLALYRAMEIEIQKIMADEKLQSKGGD